MYTGKKKYLKPDKEQYDNMTANLLKATYNEFHYLYMLHAKYQGLILTKIFPFLTAMYTILCTRWLQPTLDDCAVRVQWFSSVYIKIFKML